MKKYFGKEFFLKLMSKINLTVIGRPNIKKRDLGGNLSTRLSEVSLLEFS